MKSRVSFFLLLAAIVSPPALAGRSPTPEPCPATLDFRLERVLGSLREVDDKFHKRLELKFTDRNRQYFHRNRVNLRKLVTELDGKFYRLRHAYWSLIMAYVLQTHAYLHGEPGGAKSKLTAALQSLPVRRPDGSLGPDLFEIQLNQMVSDILFRGYVDPKRLDGRPPTVEDIQDQGTMVRYMRATLEEAEKGNPLAFAAVLDAMQERVARHGGVIRRARTSTVVALTNVTLYQFLAIFKELAMESTGRAFLDRMPFKIYSPDFIVDDALGIRALQEGANQGVTRALSVLSDPEAPFRDVGHVGGADGTLLLDDEINFPWLGALAMAGRVEDDAYYPAMRQIFTDLRKGYRKMRRDSEADVQSRRLPPDTPVYFPTSSLSQRTQMRYGTDVVRASLFLQLMLLDDATLPSDTLLDMLENRQFVVSAFSLWRLHQAHVTAVPGEPALFGVAAARANSGGGLEIRFRSQLDGLRDFALGSDEERMLGYYVQEQTLFADAYNRVIRENVGAARALQDLVAPRRRTGRGAQEPERFFLERD